jgi:hypothetical protein
LWYSGGHTCLACGMPSKISASSGGTAMRCLAVMIGLAGLLGWTATATAHDYWWKVGASVNWTHPSLVFWGAAGYPHGGHWFAIGYPQSAIHPYPWFLMYPPSATWPSTPGWTQYGVPAPHVSGWTYTYPSAGLPGYPLWPAANGQAAGGQAQAADGAAPPAPSSPLPQLWPNDAVLPGIPVSTPTYNWHPGQAVPYYWFGR